MDDIMRAIFACIPSMWSPASPDGCLSAAFGGGDDDGEEGEGEDRISRLPDAVLSSIVSRLPVKDGARTAVLSPRWRRVWASTPLVLDDADLLSDGGGPQIFWRDVADAVSRVLAAHPGPFRCVRLTNACSYAGSCGAAALSRWLGVLAAKGVQELVLVFLHAWPVRVEPPAGVLRVASLRRLYLGLWRSFPDTEHLRPGADVFPNLVELGICRTDIKAKDLDRLLQCSPALETLAFVVSYNTQPNVRVRSRSLRCVLFWMSIAEELAVVVAPRLERLILWNGCPYTRRVRRDFRTRVKIGYTPELKVLGYLEPRIHVLEIANTVIEAGTKPSPGTMVPTVKVLAVKVRFGVRQEAKMLLSFLRCFPNIETLHIMSAEADEPTGKLNFKLKFWQDVAPVECLKAHIKKVVFKNFRGERSELAFLRFVLERAQILQTLVVVLTDGDGDHASQEELGNRLKPLIYSTHRASKCAEFFIFVRSGGTSWSFRTASDLSRSDPFDC
ncbi:hypothetical protein DAI22_01g229800 [Oryza sativa Japonica Group]|nr:hypothetical protein DAI22_01g229800 [Oryza sativa Japonica Group]